MRRRRAVRLRPGASPTWGRDRGSRIPQLVRFADQTVEGTHEDVIGAHNKLNIDLSIQNLTNRRGVTDRYNTYSADVNANNSIVPDINWGIPSQYQAPRTTSLVLRYTYR